MIRDYLSYALGVGCVVVPALLGHLLGRMAARRALRRKDGT